MPSLVVVQPRFWAPSGPSPTPHTIVYPVVGGEPGRQYVEVRHQESVLSVDHDPLVVELRARLPFGQEGMAESIADGRPTIMSTSALQQRFWDKAELRDWISANCRDDVLMQATKTGWKLCCVAGEDQTPLYTFLTERRKYSFTVEYADFNELAVIEQWVENNVRGQKIALIRPSSSNLYHISIKDKEEAVLFRLRFSALG